MDKNSILAPRRMSLYLHIMADSLENPNESNKFWFISNLFKNRHKETCTNEDCDCKKQNLPQVKVKEFLQSLIKNKIKKVNELTKSNFALTIFGCYINLVYFQAFPDLLIILGQVIEKRKLSWF